MTTYRTQQALIAMIQRVQSPRGRRRAGLFSIEGTRLVERALRSGSPLETVLVSAGLAHSGEPLTQQLLDELRSAGCEIAIAPDERLRELTEGRDLGLMIGLVRLPPPLALSDILNGGDVLDRPPLLLGAVDIVDPGNVGALVRTAHASGAAAMLAVSASDPYHPRATRISRGSIFRLPIVAYDTADALLDELRRHGIAAAGTAARGGLPLPEVVWPRSGTAILMGNEAEGLPAAVQVALDFTITIPMPTTVDSYSVNAAAAVILYTAAQARRL